VNASWLLVALVVVLLIGSMAALSFAHNTRRLSPEVARKAFHVAMGLATLPFPWLFAESTPVLLLAVLACVWFEAVRHCAALQKHCGAVLSAVARRGRGEVHYAIGTALTFLLADGSPASFCVPIATLALADAAAALIGRQFGARPGAVRFGAKSLAGSAAFFVVAFAVGLTGLSIADCPFPQALAVALVLACITAVLEGVATNGADNLLIPLGAALVLQGTTLAPETTALLALLCTISVAVFALVGASMTPPVAKIAA